ncbi:MAG: D-alanyl-D-alanine carboxypeptidase [Lachnospiraceae bacterium]|nr:D-alanyl-D-alanine carboxypeptidase [Lachnospiraceae bacterium]
MRESDRTSEEMIRSEKASEDWISEKKRTDGYVDDPEAAEDERTDRRIRTVNLLIAAIALCIVVLAAVIITPMVRSATALDTSIPYDAGRYVSGTAASYSGYMQADLFASDLAVTEDNISNDAITITDETEGNLLVNLETGETLYAQNIYTRLYPASVTKLMTGIICMKYGNMDQVVTMEYSDIDLEEGAQLSGLSAGDQLTMNQLLHILLVYSANDAGMAIARTIAGSESAFVEMMNQEAQNLGMTGTHFMNPHGLHDENHYTTVYDVYLMLNAAYSYSQFSDISSLGSYTAVYNQADGSQVSSTWYATDQYLTGAHAIPEGVNLLGGKTGTTPEAGSCLTLVAQNRYGIPFIAVVLYSYNHTTLYEDMDQLLNRIND